MSYERSSQDFISQLQGLLGQVGSPSLGVEARAGPQAAAGTAMPPALQPPVQTPLSMQGEAAMAASMPTQPRAALTARETGVGSLAALAMSLDKEITELLGGEPPVRPAQQQPTVAPQLATPAPLASVQSQAHALSVQTTSASAQPLRAQQQAQQRAQQRAPIEPSMPAAADKLLVSSTAAAADKLADILREFGSAGAVAPVAPAADSRPSARSTAASAASALSEAVVTPTPKEGATATAAGPGPGLGSGTHAGSAATAEPAGAGSAAAAAVSLPPGAIGELWSVLQASKQNAARLAADLKAAQQEAEEAKERQEEADDLACMFQTQLQTRQQQLSSWTTAMLEMQEREASAKEMLRTAQDRCTQLAQQAKQAQHVAVTAQLRLERILADQQKQQQEMQRLREAAAHASEFQASPANTWPRQSPRSRPSHTGSEQDSEQAALDLRSLRAEMAAAQSRATRAELELAVARNRAVMAQQELADEEERARRAATATGAAQEELERTKAALELMGRDHDRLRMQLEELRQQLRARDEAEARRATEAAVQAAKAAVTTLVAAEASASRGHHQPAPRSFGSPNSANGNVLLPVMGGAGWGAGSAAGTGSPLLNTLLSTGDVVAHGSTTVATAEHAYRHHHQHQPYQHHAHQSHHQHAFPTSLDQQEQQQGQRQLRPVQAPQQQPPQSGAGGIPAAATTSRSSPGPVSGGVSMLTLAQYRAGAEDGACAARDTPEVSSISHGYDNLIGSASSASSSDEGSAGAGASGRGSVMARLGAAAAAAQKHGPASPAGLGPAAGASSKAAGGAVQDSNANLDTSEHAASAGQQQPHAALQVPMQNRPWSGRRTSLLLLDPADLPVGDAGPPSRYGSQRRRSAVAIHPRRSQEEMLTPTSSPSGLTAPSGEVAAQGRPSGNGKAVVAADGEEPESRLRHYVGMHGARGRAAGAGGRGSMEGDAGSELRLRPVLGPHQSMVHKPRHLVSPPRRASSHDNQAPVRDVATGSNALPGASAVPGPEALRTSGPPSVRASIGIVGASAVTSGGLTSPSVGTGRAMRMLLDASCSSGGAGGGAGGGARSSVAISIGGGLTDEMVPLSRAPSSARRRLSFARSSTATGVAPRTGRYSGSGLAAAGAGGGAAPPPPHPAQATPPDTSAATRAWVQSVSRRSVQSGNAAGVPSANAADGASSSNTQRSPLDSPAVGVDSVVDEMLRRVQSAERAWEAAIAERNESGAGAGAREHGEGAGAAAQPQPTLAELRMQLAAAAGPRMPPAASPSIPAAGTRFRRESVGAVTHSETPLDAVVGGARSDSSAPEHTQLSTCPTAAPRPQAQLNSQAPPAATPSGAPASATQPGGPQSACKTDSGAPHGVVVAVPKAAEEKARPSHQPQVTTAQPSNATAQTPLATPPRLSLQTAPRQAFKSFPDPEPSDSPRERVRHTPRRGGRRSRSPSPGPSPARPSPALRGPAGNASDLASALPSYGGAASIAPAAPTAIAASQVPKAAEPMGDAAPAPLETIRRPAAAVPVPFQPAALEATVATREQLAQVYGAHKDTTQETSLASPCEATAHNNTQPRQLTPASLNDSASTVAHGYDVRYAAGAAATGAGCSLASRADAAAAAGLAQAFPTAFHGVVASSTVAGPDPVHGSAILYGQPEDQQAAVDPYAAAGADAEAAALMRQLLLTPRSRMLSPAQVDSYRVSASLAASSVADSLAAVGDSRVGGSFAFGRAGPAELLPVHLENAPPLPQLQQQQLGRGAGVAAGGGRPSGVLSPVAEQRALEARVVKAHGLDAGLAPLRVYARSTSAGEVVQSGGARSPGCVATPVAAQQPRVVQRRGKPWWLRLLLATVGRGRGAHGSAASGPSSSASSSDSSDRLPSYMQLGSPDRRVQVTTAAGAPASPMHARLGTSSPYAVRDPRFSARVVTVPSSPQPTSVSPRSPSQLGATSLSPSGAAVLGRRNDVARSAQQRGGATEKRAAKDGQKSGVGAELQQALINAAIAAGGVAIGVAVVLGVAGFAEHAVAKRRLRMDDEEAPALACGCKPQAAPRREQRRPKEVAERRGPQEVAEIEEGQAGVPPGRD
ncbi:hypothetical protein HYH02_013248 [Chlamydomonas schloesseri]|uniref:Uncharacterized protein n=1 Tax=Chlamydomonas schloesseri TaxID=2026947 RepID=A0A835STP7_9CHLO|nr:hypothetical protein HYH02_013248 [Chlamydomonas schloesseri]|eukprot:KAG2431671.1 hypothetical protein HYH02_013248 [Chlamydomonas schloesseri]